jgi:nicotinamide-nucleotide amidase
MRLAELGLPAQYSVTIPDEPEAIAEALDYCWQRFDVVITTGGLGPTQDDLTKDVIAGYFGKDLHFNEQVWSHITSLFSQRNVPMPQSNRSQAMVPGDFQVLKNERGTAPGLYYQDAGKHFFALQGVPLEMKYIFDSHIRQILKDSYQDAQGVIVRNIHTYGVAESALAELLDLQRLPHGVSMAWLPQTGRVDLRLSGVDAHALAVAEAYVQEQVGEFIWAYDEDDPARYLLRLLKAKKLNLAVAESCTGGLVQRFLTDVPGASAVFLGGVVSYANRIKEELLGVDTAILEKSGAVSEACAIAMAQGVQKLCAADVALAITGIAGPDGASAEKPVGTVYFSWRIKDRQFTLHKILTGDRDSIRHKAAEAAILELSKSIWEE